MVSPVILFAYNRPDHFQKTVEALSRNELASQTPVFIFCDGPRDAVLTSAMHEVRRIADELTGFLSVECVFREQNMGLCRSVIAGVSHVLEKYNTVIVIEDDIVTAPDFLRYMNDALRAYAQDERVFSIGAYNFPHKTMPIPSDYAYDTYLSLRCCSWGWAVWADRWRTVDWSMSYFEDFTKNPEWQHAFNRSGPDLSRMLADQYNKRINSWAIQFCYAHFSQHRYCVYPVQTFAANIGLDSSGTHCSVDPRRSHAQLVPHRFPLKFCPSHVQDERLDRLFYDAYAPVDTRSRFCQMRQASEVWAKTFFRQTRKNLLAWRRPSLLAVNTLLEGNFAHAALAQFEALREIRPDAEFLTLTRNGRKLPYVGVPDSMASVARELANRDSTLLTSRYPNRDQNIRFSLGVRYSPLRVPLWRFQPELLHLHDITGGFLRVEDLMSISCPVVWTLRDAWPFTGGCHDVGDCEGYKDRCGHCPVLHGKPGKTDMSKKLMRRKARIYAPLNLTVVAPSRCLAAKARQSELFKLRRIEYIPDGVDTQLFAPTDTIEARTHLQLPPDKPVIVCDFSTQDARCHSETLVHQALKEWNKACTLLSFGSVAPSWPDCPQVTHCSLGLACDDASRALVYSAADVLCCLSGSATVPEAMNAVAEAMACGTACIAPSGGEFSEIIDHKENGYLLGEAVPATVDVQAESSWAASDLAAGLEWLTTHPEPAALRAAARQSVLVNYDLSLSVRRYEQLFEELTRKSV